MTTTTKAISILQAVLVKSLQTEWKFFQLNNHLKSANNDDHGYDNNHFTLAQVDPEPINHNYIQQTMLFLLSRLVWLVQ